MQLSRFQPLAALGRSTLELIAPHCCVERVARDLDPFRLRDWRGQVIYLVKGQLKLEFPDGSVKVLVGGLDDALLPLVSAGQAPCRQQEHHRDRTAAHRGEDPRCGGDLGSADIAESR